MVQIRKLPSLLFEERSLVERLVSGGRELTRILKDNPSMDLDMVQQLVRDKSIVFDGEYLANGAHRLGYPNTSFNIADWIEQGGPGNIKLSISIGRKLDAFRQEQINTAVIEGGDIQAVSELSHADLISTKSAQIADFSVREQASQVEAVADIENQYSMQNLMKVDDDIVGEFTSRDWDDLEFIQKVKQGKKILQERELGWQGREFEKKN